MGNNFTHIKALRWVDNMTWALHNSGGDFEIQIFVT